MGISVEEIIDKAVELKSLINENHITISFEEGKKAISNDAEAQKILSKLIQTGEKLSQTIYNQDSRENYSEELALLEKEMEAHPVVKEFLTHQKQYLNMLQLVIEKIKEPEM